MRDGLQNFEARLGLGTDNQSSSSTYGFLPLTRNRAELDNMYRGSWIVRQAVGVVADDMTRAGVEFRGLPDNSDVERLQNSMKRMGFWSNLSSGVRWGRLYGGAIGVMLIDGQKLDEPLRPETCGKGQLKGLLIIDRWSLNVSSELVQELGPDFGKPVFYTPIVGRGMGVPSGNIHHTRVMRFEGDDLPYFQRQYEQGWGMSIVEPFHDRLVAFDSTTQGTAQMVFRAHLRILKMKNLRKSIADGGKAFEAALSQVDTMRRYQTLEGISLIDAEDDFSTTTYAFSGLPEVLIQMSQQIAGATGIPVVKLFGMSPAGFSTGESDLRSYYDNVALKQERALRRPLEIFVSMLYRSELGREPTPEFGYDFASLYGLTANEKAQIATSVGSAVTGAETTGLIKKSTALNELRSSGRITGIFATITDEEIEEAVEEEKIPLLPGVPSPEDLPDDVGAPQTEEQTEAVSDPAAGAPESRVTAARAGASDAELSEPFLTSPFPLRRIDGGRK